MTTTEQSGRYPSPDDLLFDYILGRLDPKVAFDKLLDMPSSSRSNFFAGQIAIELASKDPAYAEDWLNTSEDVLKEAAEDDTTAGARSMFSLIQMPAYRELILNQSLLSGDEAWAVYEQMVRYGSYVSDICSHPSGSHEFRRHEMSGLLAEQAVVALFQRFSLTAVDPGTMFPLSSMISEDYADAWTAGESIATDVSLYTSLPDRLPVKAFNFQIRNTNHAISRQKQRVRPLAGTHKYIFVAKDLALFRDEDFVSRNILSEAKRELASEFDYVAAKRLDRRTDKLFSIVFDEKAKTSGQS